MGKEREWETSEKDRRTGRLGERGWPEVLLQPPDIDSLIMNVIL